MGGINEIHTYAVLPLGKIRKRESKATGNYLIGRNLNEVKRSALSKLSHNRIVATNFNDFLFICRSETKPSFQG